MTALARPARLAALLAAAAAILLVAILVAGRTPAQGQHPEVAVFPSDHTLVASPDTQVSFRGATIGELTNVRVTGSQTGRHYGHLEAHSDGKGASFIPDSGFEPGEQVSVKTDLPLVGGDVVFTIAHFTDNYHLEPKASDDPPAEPTAATKDGKSSPPPGAQYFKSRPALHPPSTPVDTRSSSLPDDGPIFLGPKKGPGQHGPMIIDDHGNLIWFYKRPTNMNSVFAVDRQTYKGQPVVTWWEGWARPGIGLGDGHVLDQHYRQVATVKAGNGYRADLHEFRITRRNTALVLAYQPVIFGGGTLCMDTLVQEIDIPTGLVMFEWHSLGEVSSSETYVSHPSSGVPFDIAHLNSADMAANGDILVSARHTNALYMLDHKRGHIRWRLGGKRSDFSLSSSARFVAQHDARLQPGGSITLYDNGGPPDTGRESRGLWLNVDRSRRKVNVRHSYRRGLSGLSQGSMQVLGSGNVFIGWGGNERYFSEFTPGGSLVFDAHFYPHEDDTYWARRAPWTGTPDEAPAVYASTSGGQTYVYASWNGATEVAKWQVLTGSSRTALVPGKTAPKSGFETRIVQPGSAQYVAVRAYDANGAVIGQSPAVQTQ